MTEVPKFLLLSLTMLRYQTLYCFQDKQHEMIVRSAVQFMETHWLCAARAAVKPAVKCGVPTVQTVRSATKLHLYIY